MLWQVTGNDWAQHDCAEIVSTYGEGGRLALAGFERFMEEVSEQLVQFAIPTRASLRGETRSGQESTVVMNKVVGPNHARGDGILQAGVLMKWVDLAALACCWRHGRESAVTMGVDSFHFERPFEPPVALLYAISTLFRTLPTSFQRYVTLFHAI